MTRTTLRSTARRGGRELDELVAAPSPDPSDWEITLLDSLASLVGGEVAFDVPPAPLAHHEGPWAFGCRLRALDGELPSPWQGDLIVRLADDTAETAREAAAIRAVEAAGIGAPLIVAELDLPSPGATDQVRPRAVGALVCTAPEGTPLPELIGYNLGQSEALLGGFATNHAAVHDGVDVAELAGAVPTVSLEDELARIDAGRFGEEVAWLAEHAPEPAAPVLCHGGYQPLCVSGPEPDRWDEVGGPGRGLHTRNWCGAVLAERELDVAFTLVAFWFAPHFAPNRSERTAIKMIRNTLSNSYKLAYAGAAPVDGGRLRFWQAFHAVRGMARVAGAYDGVGSPFAVVDRGPLPAVLGEELSRYFRMQRRG